MKPYRNPSPARIRKRRQQKLARRLSRARAVAAKNASATVCQYRHCGGSLCGGVLESLVDRTTGRLLPPVCRLCERRLAGICRDCPRGVKGRVRSALYCAPCSARHVIERAARYRERHREEVNRRARDAKRRLPLPKRQRNSQKNRLWRRANPDKVRAHHADHRARHRDAIAAYMRDYRAMHREQIATRLRNKRKGLIRRTCVTTGCDVVLTGRAKKCEACKTKHAQISRALLVASVGSRPARDTRRRAA